MVATVIAMVASCPVVTKVASAATVVAFGIAPSTRVAAAYAFAAPASDSTVSAMMVVPVTIAFEAVPVASAFVLAAFASVPVEFAFVAVPVGSAFVLVAFAFVPVESAFVVVSATVGNACAASAFASAVVSVLVEFGAARPAC